MMRKSPWIAVFCSAVLALAGFAIMMPSAVHAASNVLDYRSFPSPWQAKIDALSNEGKIPGAVVIVKSPDWGVRVGTTGKANIAENIPQAPDMQFRIGSVSKSLTAMIALQLEQEGLIRLDDLVSKYLGETILTHNADKVTIQHCLQMTSGLPEYLNDKNILMTPDLYPTKAWTPQDLVDSMNTMAVVFNPGDTYPNPYETAIYQTPADQASKIPYWWYTNSGLTLVGMIIEKVTGHTMAEEVKSRICDKLGLDDTYFATDETIPSNMIHGYSRANSLQVPTYEDWQDVTNVNPSYAWAAGAVISTPWDMLRYLEALFNSEELLNKGTQKKWKTFVSADLKWFNTDYGVGGLIQAHQAYGDCRGHGGAFPGYHTLIYNFKDSEASIVISTNTWDGSYEVVLLDSVMPLALNAPCEPAPKNNAANVTIDGNGGALLKWQPGRYYGETYNIYVGTNADEVDKASAVTSSVKQYTSSILSAAVDSLQKETQYYWRVDAVTKNNGTIQGPLWSFSTGSTANVTVADNAASLVDLSNSQDKDADAERALAVKWNLTDADAKAYHVYVSVDGGAYQYLGQAASTSDTYYEWKSGYQKFQNPTFQNGPQFGHKYAFKVYVLTASGSPVYSGPYANTGPVEFLSN
ncbi:MAG: serine hydrolase domain-containing protein [Candidatus Omnitrophota bacterium]